MALGFPAYHREEFKVFGSREELIERVKKVFDKLKWNIVYENSSVFEVFVKLNILSWGERITVEILDDNLLVVTSKCAVKTQALDWGKNKKNVKKFTTEFQQHA